MNQAHFITEDEFANQIFKLENLCILNILYLSIYLTTFRGVYFLITDKSLLFYRMKWIEII